MSFGGGLTSGLFFWLIVGSHEHIRSFSLIFLVLSLKFCAHLCVQYELLVEAPNKKLAVDELG